MVKRITRYSPLLAAVLLSWAGMVHAAGSAVVTASVSVQNVSVTVASGAINYGTLSPGTSKSTIASELNNTQTATNNGNVAEDLNIRGQNSAAWTLAATPGSEQYVHKYCYTSCGTPPTNFTALTTGNQSLASNLAVAGTQTFDLQLTAPTSTTTFTSQSVDVTVQAVAH